MGHNRSWVTPNTSHPRNTLGAEAGANRSGFGELSEAQLYRQFTTTVQVVIFIGSLLGKPASGATNGDTRVAVGCGVPCHVRGIEREFKLSEGGHLQPRGWKQQRVGPV